MRHRVPFLRAPVWALLTGGLLASGGRATESPAAGLQAWTDYRVIMWVGDSAAKQPAKLPLFYQRLREMGVNTAMVYGDGDPQALLDNHFPYYVENLVNRGLCLKFNSKVTDWDKFVTEWAKTGRPDAALVRDYSLEDPAWREWAHGEIRRIARKNQPHHPLAYDIRDELSTTISANPFDYDFSPLTLAKFRIWLRGQYADLAALNHEWETTFASWEDVKPFTTDAIKNRMASGDAHPRGRPDWQAVQGLRFDPRTARQTPTRWNFAPWADFRTFMDSSLAGVLADLRAAAHEVDPATPVGIEGTQMPAAFGGYDLWRLSQSLDWVEPYDIGNAREIFGSFMPGRPLVTTLFENDTAHARRRLWHLLLEGDRGCIVWWSEDCLDWQSPDYALTPKGRALASALREMTTPLAQLFLRAERLHDPVFIHYSQPSIQVDWLLESTVDGSTWLRRFSSYEADHNRQARVRNGWLKALQDLGFAPQFVAAAQIEGGALARLGNAALILPASHALADRETAQIATFLESSQIPGITHLVLADGVPGAFDGHGKLRASAALESHFPAAVDGPDLSRAARNPGTTTATHRADIAHYAAARLAAKPDSTAVAWSAWLREQLGDLRPEITVTGDPHVRIHRFRAGRSQLVAFERNVDYQMSEDLKQAGGNENLEKPVAVTARLPRPGHVYDLRSQKYLGSTDELHFTLDPWQPALFAVLEQKVAEAALLESLARSLPDQK